MIRLIPRVAAALCLVVVFAAQNVKAQEQISVYLDSTAQVIRGFGAANIVGWRPDMTDAEIETAFGTGEGQLGFSILRLKIDPDPGQWQRNVETAKKAFDRGVLIFASPWNAPDDLLEPGVEGDTVAVDKYDEYAAHLEAFRVFMADNGVDLYAISVQNEPDYAEEWTGWSPEGMVEFLRDHAPTIGTRIIAPESFQFRREMSDPILNDPLAAANTDIIGGHTYGGGLRPYPLAQKMGKEVWMTEHYTDSQHSANLWPLALDVAKDIQGTMFSNMSAYVWWYIVRYYGPIADGERSASFPNEEFGEKGEVTKRGYIMSQFARFIRPGYVRVHTDQPNPFSSVSVTAYRNGPDLVLVAVNESGSTREVALSLEGGSAERFRRYVTSATQNVEHLDDAEVSDGALAVTLAPASVTTFVAADAMVSTEDATTEAFILGQNAPNPVGARPATIEFALPAPRHVTLTVYNVLGQEVARITDGPRQAGAHEVVFDASGLPSGVYIYRLTAGEWAAQRRMTILR